MFPPLPPTPSVETLQWGWSVSHRIGVGVSASVDGSRHRHHSAGRLAGEPWEAQSHVRLRRIRDLSVSTLHRG